MHKLHILMGVGISCALLGYLTLWWPWMVLALVCFSFSGRWVLAVILALSIDLLWGTPTGMFHFLVFPWTVVTGILLLTHFFFAQKIRSRMPEYL